MLVKAKGRLRPLWELKIAGVTGVRSWAGGHRGWYKIRGMHRAPAHRTLGRAWASFH